jgi:hypothetical protein
VQDSRRSQIDAALNTFCSEFPEEAPKLQEHRGAIIEAILADCKPAIDSPLHRLEFVPSYLARNLEREALSPCTEAIAVVAVDTVFFVLGMLGLHASNQQRMGRVVWQQLGGKTLLGFQREVQALDEADGAIAKAKALFSLVKHLKNAGAFTAVWTELKNEMTWWQWTKSGILSVAQFTAWFATDGVAFIAEAALLVMSATQLIQDVATSVKTCGGQGDRNLTLLNSLPLQSSQRKEEVPVVRSARDQDPDTCLDSAESM